MNDMSIVYVFTDFENRIIAVSSGEFLESLDGWTEIDRGYGDKFFHAQNNYFPKPLQTPEGIWIYKLEDGVAMERTAEEIAADAAALPERQAGEADYITALEELGVDFNE